MKLIQYALTLSAVAALTACGGGGDDATPATATPLALANYGNVSAAAVDSVTGNTGAALETFLPQASQSRVSIPYINELSSGDVLAISRLAIRQVTQRPTTKARAAAVIQETEVCGNSGSLTIILNDADNNEQPSAGDSLTINANNCIVERGQPAVNGQVNIRINSIRLSNDDDIIDGSLSLTFSNVSSGGINLNGAADVSIDTQSLTLRHRNLTATSAGTSRAFDFTQRQNRANGNTTVDGNLVINGSSYLLSTPTILIPGAIAFSRGTLRIADRSGGYTDVVMSLSGYTANLYLPGDALVDASTTVPWSSR